MNFESIAGQYYAGYVLSDVVNISLHGCNRYFRSVGCCALAVHERFQNLDGIPHYLG